MVQEKEGAIYPNTDLKKKTQLQYRFNRERTYKIGMKP